MAQGGPNSSELRDLRKELREKALNHSSFYADSLSKEAAVEAASGSSDCVSGSAPMRAPRTARASLHALPSVSELRSKFEPTSSMQYLRPPRTPSTEDDIIYSDDDVRVAVRRRSRELSDDSAIELEAPRLRRHSHPREITPPPEVAGAYGPQTRDRTLIEEHEVELGRRRSSFGVEIRGRSVRCPSVVVSDYSDSSTAVGATEEEVEWLRSKCLAADSACSSTSTLSSREEEHYELPPPVAPKKDTLNEWDEVTSDMASNTTLMEP